MEGSRWLESTVPARQHGFQEGRPTVPCSPATCTQDGPAWNHTPPSRGEGAEVRAFLLPVLGLKLHMQLLVILLGQLTHAKYADHQECKTTSPEDDCCPILISILSVHP
jgi:hypothetical protein